MKIELALLTLCAISMNACNNAGARSEVPVSAKVSTALKPAVITQQVNYDTDDPAIWINPADHSKSLIIGTDKDSDGGLYVFDLKGNIISKVADLKRPNNVDITYGLVLNGKPVDIAVVTERETNKLRIYSLPDMKAVDGGGIEIFVGDTARGPMGIALYKRPSDNAIFAVAGRKSGPSDGYLWQYLLTDDGTGKVKATLVRKFGRYSGKKEIESIAVDNKLGFVYYSDEQYGVHKYYAEPDSGDKELAVFATAGFVSDHEGISIYQSTDTTGYILVSNQQKNTFMVYPREGSGGNRNDHPLIAEVPVSTIESDGSDVTSIALGAGFPKGLFVAMSNGKVFHYYSWEEIQKVIDGKNKSL